MATTQYVAFLRAVNVGGRTVKMAALKGILDDAGFDDVRTFIASGNVLFTSSARSPALESRLEAVLKEALGFTVTVMVRNARELSAAAAFEPFSSDTAGDGGLHVGFLKERPSAAALGRTLALATDTDLLRVEGREIYWLARNNISNATITGAAMEKALQTAVTFRNVNTVRRLVALIDR